MAGLNEPTPEDLAHIAQIEAETETAAQAEDDALLIGMAPYLLMGGCFVLVALLPAGRRFFDLSFGAWQQTLTSLAVAGCAGVALEALWRFDRRREARLGDELSGD